MATRNVDNWIDFTGPKRGVLDHFRKGNKMSLAQILAFLGPIAAGLEPILLNLEQGTLMPKLQEYIDKETSPDLKLLFQTLATALDAFAQAEIKKLG